MPELVEGDSIRQRIVVNPMNLKVERKSGRFMIVIDP